MQRNRKIFPDSDFDSSRKLGQEEVKQPIVQLLLVDESLNKQLVHKVFYQSIALMLISMRLFGMIFDLHFSKQEPKTAQSPVGKKDSKKPSSKRPGRVCVGYIYSCFVQIILWLNIVRLLTSFTKNDRMDGITLSKLSSFFWNLACTAMHTTCFVACKSGRLASTLNELAERSIGAQNDCYSKTHETNQFTDDYNKENVTQKSIETISNSISNTSKLYTDEANGNIMPNLYLNTLKESTILEEARIKKEFLSSVTTKRAKQCAVLAWCFFIMNVVFSVYLVFSTSLLDTQLSPFGTYIFIVNIIPVKIAYIVVGVYSTAGWSFPPAMAFFVSTCLQNEFKVVSRGFKRAVILEKECTGEKGGKFSGKIECFRIRHHKIARLVEKFDKWLCLHYSITVVGHIAIATITLYIALFASGLYTSPLVLAIELFWMLTSLLQLMIASSGAIMVNNAVSFK